MKSIVLTSALAAGLILGSSLPPAQAREIKVAGIAPYQTTQQTATTLADGSTLYRFTQVAVDIEDPPGPWNLNPNQCYGIFIVTADGKSATGSGACDGYDKDGDHWGMWWSTTDMDRWGVIYGTGKFAGMTGGGTTETLYQDDQTLVLRYSGTLNMKD